MDMEYTTLGESGLRVSRLAFGCEALGGYDWGKVDDQESIAAVRRALDLGINFFDTADVYGLGRSEEMLSRALGARRREVVIATKFGINWELYPGGGRARTFRDSSPKRVVEALEGSLRRLKLDSIPLYQVHWADPDVSVRDTMEALVKCQEQGKIQHIGYSNATCKALYEAHQIHQLASLEVPYNLGDRTIEEGTIPCCMELGIGVLAYEPFAQGLLTGKYDRNSKFGEDDRRHRLKHFQGIELERYLKIVDMLKKIALRYGRSPAQVALRWVLDNTSITAAIVGIKTPDQADENVCALGWELSPADVAYLGGETSQESISKGSKA